MLWVYPQTNSAHGKAYFDHHYYSEGHESAGLWGGKGARLLELNGEIQRDDFHNLCDNIHPQTGERLTPRDRERIYYDFNFRAPKSISVVGLMRD